MLKLGNSVAVDIPIWLTLEMKSSQPSAPGEDWVGDSPDRIPIDNPRVMGSSNLIYIYIYYIYTMYVSVCLFAVSVNHCRKWIIEKLISKMRLCQNVMVLLQST